MLDFDHYKKDENGAYLMSETQRKEIDLVIDYLINYWKLPWYEVSKSGARKLHLDIDELPRKSRLWWKSLVVGDILGKGSQTTLPLSKNRRVEFSKWSKGEKNTELPKIKLENWKKDLAKFSLSGGEMKRKVFARLRQIVSKSRSKELNYYGIRLVEPLKIFTFQPVKELSSLGGSRDSFYYQVSYLDPVSQRVGKFLVDSGWRKKEFKKIINQTHSPPCLWLKRGERMDFLLGVG